MNLEILDRNRKYEIHLTQITQLCGVDFYKKQFIIKSLCKYFSNSKYASYEEFLQDNVRCDNKEVGRKYFTIFHISSREDLINTIKLSKTSLMMKYLTEEFSEFECQKIMDRLEEELENLYVELNKNVRSKMRYIEISYEMKKIMDIIQSSEIISSNEKVLEELTNEELFLSYIQLMGEIQRRAPEKIIIIIENIDHLLDYSTYVKVMSEVEKFVNGFDAWIVFSTSTEGFVIIDEDKIEGINVINDCIFSFPQLQEIERFICKNYPREVVLGRQDLVEEIRAIVQNIGREGYLINVRSNVMLKLLQDSLCISTGIANKLNSIEYAFLKSESML